MMFRIYKSALAMLAVFLITAVAGAIQTGPASGPKSIRVIYTSDTQGYVDPCG
jgi:hypothetical protein